MTGRGVPVEKLRDYLRGLSHGSRTMLIGELERSLLRGDNMPGADVVLQELRRTARDAGRPSPRIGNFARLFFQPLEPFLVDDAAEHEHPGRIARTALEPIWRWISRDLMPAEAAAVSEQAGKALLEDDEAEADRLTRAFQERAMLRMQEAVDAAAGNERALMRLSVQVATPRPSAHVRTLIDVLKARNALDAIAGQLPPRLKNLDEANIEAVTALLATSACADPRVLVHALVLVMNRLAARWQLVRLAVKAAGTDRAARLADTPSGAAVTIVLAETERLVRELKTELKVGGGGAITTLLKEIHDAARGLRTELDLTPGAACAQRLAALRSDIADLLKDEIESMPGRVRRLLRPRPASEIAPGSSLSPGDVEDAESLVEFVGACRQFAGELAISEMTQRTYGELQHYLEQAAPALIESLRQAGEAERPYRQSQVDAAIRLAARVFGQDHAAVLQKAADVAVHRERRSAG